MGLLICCPYCRFLSPLVHTQTCLKPWHSRHLLSLRAAFQLEHREWTAVAFLKLLDGGSQPLPSEMELLMFTKEIGLRCFISEGKLWNTGKLQERIFFFLIQKLVHMKQVSFHPSLCHPQLYIYPSIWSAKKGYFEPEDFYKAKSFEISAGLLVPYY